MGWLRVFIVAFSLIANVSRVTNGTTGSIDTTGANLIVISVCSYAAAGEPTVSDSKSNTWTGLTAVASTNARERLYYCLNPSVGSGHTFTITSGGSNAFPFIGVEAWSGAHASSSFDQQNGASTNGATSRTTGSVTPTEDNELLVAGLNFNASNTISIDGGFTISEQRDFVGGSNFGGAIAHLVQTTATAANPSFSWSSSCEGAAAIATFKAAAGAATHGRLIGGQLTHSILAGGRLVG